MHSMCKKWLVLGFLWLDLSHLPWLKELLGLAFELVGSTATPMAEPLPERFPFWYGVISAISHVAVDLPHLGSYFPTGVQGAACEGLRLGPWT